MLFCIGAVFILICFVLFLYTGTWILPIMLILNRHIPISPRYSKFSPINHKFSQC